MPSHLLSKLAAEARAVDMETFRRAHDHDWLVWEPGPWQPARAAATTLQQRPPEAPRPGAEALAFPLPAKDPVLVGRDEACEVSIGDATVSARHLALHREADGGWALEELGSSNGTVVEDRAAEPGRRVKLAEGARIRAGSVFLTFHRSVGLYLRAKLGF